MTIFRGVKHMDNKMLIIRIKNMDETVAYWREKDSEEWDKAYTDGFDHALSNFKALMLPGKIDKRVKKDV